jgi:hypothetical protein
MRVTTISRDHRPRETSTEKGREIIPASARRRWGTPNSQVPQQSGTCGASSGGGRTWTPIRYDIIPSTERCHCRQNFNTPNLVPGDRLQTSTRRSSSIKEQRFVRVEGPLFSSPPMPLHRRPYENWSSCSEVPPPSSRQSG